MNYETDNRASHSVPKTAELNLETLGRMCLDQLAEDPAQLAEFMATTGFSPATLRKAVGSDELNRGLLDYFASNEPLLLALTANRGMKPEAFMRVWHMANPTE
jgi:Protein of unknown function (DUF3572)